MTTTESRNLWQRLTAPHPEIVDPIRQQRARVLAVITLVLLVFDLLALGLALAIQGSIPPWGFVGPVVLFFLYFSSRRRRPEIGGAGTVLGLIIATTVVLSLSSTANEIYLLVLGLPILLSVLILEARMVAAMIAVTIAAVVLLFVLDPVWVYSAEIYLAPLALVAGLISLIGAIAIVRESDLRVIREQGTEVQQYSRQLEEEVQTRTQNIISVAEIGRQLAETRDLDLLMKRTVDLIVENFDFYHAQIFVVDEREEFAVLRASTGAAGRKLLERNHRLAVGSQSVIGQVISRGESVIALDTDADAVHRRNELLPNTRSEMALPLSASGRVIGSLDIQSTAPNAFGQTDIPIFQTLADQLAVAIERIRLFDRTQEDIERIELLNQQLTGSSWGRYMAGREAPLGYRAGPMGIEPIRDIKDMDGEAVIEMPLSIRGETIGMLEVVSEDGFTPDVDTQYMLQAIAERVAQALDTTRLGEQSRRQAEQEQILSFLSAELQASADINTVMRIAAEQASRALGTSRGFIQLILRTEDDATFNAEG